MGAEVVGLDFSDEAIGAGAPPGRRGRPGGRASFVHGDVYDADQHLGGRRFDIVFVSWGAIEWLPDLERWAGIVARHLAPGGVFYMAEIHPLAYRLEEIQRRLRAARRLHVLLATSPDVDPVEGLLRRPRRRCQARRPRTAGRIRIGRGPRGAARAQGCASSTCTSSRSHRRRSGTWMVRDDDRWWWLPDDPAASAGTCPSATRSWRTATALRRTRCLRTTSRRTSPAGTSGPRSTRRPTLYDVEGFKAGRSSLTRHRGGGARPAGRRGHASAAPAVPLRPGHAQLGAPRRRRDRRRLLGRGRRAGAPPGRRGRPLRARHLPAEQRLRAARRSSPGQFDVVFTSWGVLNWLGDLEAWAKVVAALRQARRHLLPGGVPPVRLSARRRRHARLPTHRVPVLSVRQAATLRRTRLLRRPQAKTVHNVTYEWNHGFAEIIDPLLRRTACAWSTCTSSPTRGGCPFPSSSGATTAGSASRATRTSSR